MNDAIDWLFRQGHAADLVLGVMLIELIWLTRFGGWTVRNALLRLMPGALMMVALHAALDGSDWRWIAGSLALAFLPHIADLRRR